MSQMNTYADSYAGFDIAAHASEDSRAAFLRRTYLHLAGALFAFGVICAAILATPLAPMLTALALSSSFSWLIFILAFAAVGWVADRWAQAEQAPPMQYLGLGVYVVAEAIIFTPLLFIAQKYFGNAIIGQAAALTLAAFISLTAVAFMTRADFSFLRGILIFGTIAAFGAIIAGMFFGFNLGLFFSVAMIMLAGGYILYYTGNVIHHYRTNQHVAASLALFSAVALMLWYVLQLLMSLASSDD